MLAKNRLDMDKYSSPGTPEDSHSGSCEMEPRSLMEAGGCGQQGRSRCCGKSEQWKWGLVRLWSYTNECGKEIQEGEKRLAALTKYGRTLKDFYKLNQSHQTESSSQRGKAALESTRATNTRTSTVEPLWRKSPWVGSLHNGLRKDWIRWLIGGWYSHKMK